jgi:hypothetical protein
MRQSSSGADGGTETGLPRCARNDGLNVIATSLRRGNPVRTLMVAQRLDCHAALAMTSVGKSITSRLHFHLNLGHHFDQYTLSM